MESEKNYIHTNQEEQAIVEEQGLEGGDQSILEDSEKLENGVEGSLEASPEVEMSLEESAKRRAEESQVSYLNRMVDLMIEKISNDNEEEKLFCDPCRIEEDDLTKETLELVDFIMEEANRSQENVCDSLKNQEVIDSIEGRLSRHDKFGLKSSEEFDRTERNRNFFSFNETGMGSAAKRETYWNTLFFPFNMKVTQDFAKKILDNKTIVSLGGGRSKIESELNQYNINPKRVVNVDPFVDNIENGADLIVPISACGEDFIDVMREQGIEEADEILAEYSVPAYLSDPKEIEQLVKNIDNLLAVNGDARIWPLGVGGGGTDLEFEERKKALADGLKNLNEMNNYEILSYDSMGRQGLILHKLALSSEDIKRKENIQEKKDENDLDLARAELEQTF